MSDTAAEQSARDDRDVDILGSFEHLKDALFRYYNTPFGLADEYLERERQALFDVDGGAWRRPLLEVRPRYVTEGEGIAASVRAAGAHPDLAELVQLGLLQGLDSLYEHQHRALVAAVRDGRDVVVTAGTGSGKTESFMLPVLADLVRESAAWPVGTLPSNRWWTSPQGGYQPQRAGERGRHAAVRALVLYPMNALVDDQMMRLRKALDSDEVRAWLAQSRPGHRFYFGRYTGATPVPGDIGAAAGVKTLRKEFAATEERSRQAHKADGDGQFFIPRLDGAEMRSRWDMIQAPPDVMITNYSMLNVMLMRARESGIFEKTRRWLEETPNARFTLVVDELHMYRGTAGTEIAYLLRNLRHRLGLDNKPEKFRILAASASLEAPRDLDFLQEFFGTDRDRFEVLGGQLVLPSHTRTDLSEYAETYAALGASPEPADADRLLSESGAPDAFVNALRDGERLIADFDEAVAARLFPAKPHVRAEALRGVLAALRRSGDPNVPKLRGHLFFRNIPGVWACSDPECPDAARPGNMVRTVGKLYSRPTPRCSCNARVLELLYCQTCGDAFLGGYAPESAFRDTKGGPFEAALLADLPDLDSLPDAAALGQSAANYIVYWPRKDEPVTDKLSWNRTSDKGVLSGSFEFKRSKYDPRTGMLRNQRDHTGWSFHVTVPRPQNVRARLKAEHLPAAPTQCPSCGDDWELQQIGTDRLSLSDPRRMRTPVRSMRTGFEKVNQVLTTGILSLLPKRQAVVFSDSRQDAAKLSAGLGLRHYQDLLRMLLATEVEQQGDPIADLAAVSGYYLKSPDRPVDADTAKAARKRLRARDRDAYDRWEKFQKTQTSQSLDDDLDDELLDPTEEAELYSLLSHVPSLDSHAATVAERLVQKGVNPGGPKASLQQTASAKGVPPQPWTSLYQWPEDEKGRVQDESGLRLSERQEHLRQDMREALTIELLGGLFGSAGRDFESLGLGWLTTTSDQAPLEAERASDAALARASLRVLGHMRRFSGLRSPADEPPKKLRQFWTSAAEHLKKDPEDLRATVERIWGTAVIKYLIQPEHVALRHGRDETWTCSNCHRRHLHPGVGVCTKCRRPLPTKSEPFDSIGDDYYAWMARERFGDFRLNTAELTGQTDRLDSQARQARFQGIFLSGREHKRPDTLDVLSVTTTMEAGVDIGPLSAVLMANMPPTRFNYQQRVGRAGRRSSPVALALTVCRGRSHDEHYFQNPHRIVNDATPRPYLSTDMRDIYQRVLAAEVLRRAFDAVRPDADDDGQLDPTRNVHGQFGHCVDWPAMNEAVGAWIKAHDAEIRGVAEALAERTRSVWSPAKAAEWVATKLVTLVTQVADHPRGHHELSQRLAESGLLPMFGFPTSARYLYTKRPFDSHPWPPSGVVDRSLDIAISQFAPGAETVKDGQVHTAAGVVAFEPTGRTPRAVGEPLGQAVPLGMCRACGHIAEDVETLPVQDDDSPPLPCRACGAADGSYREIELREPAGFYCAGKARDFDGNFAWRARSLSPRTAADLESGAPKKIEQSGLVVHAGKGRRYSVNDNGGKLFNFAKVSSTALWSGAYLETGAAELFPWLAKDFTADGEILTSAIGATQRTDLFLIGPQAGEIPDAGLRLNLASVPQSTGFPDDRSGRRTAWYSLAALLRMAAGSLLQVQPNEIASGIHGTASTTREARTFAFLSDTLDNGAGYCTHLAEADVFKDLMAIANEMLEKFATGAHGRDCRGSCYECLRDYTNMAYHSLLDWRLAGELVTILHGKGAAGPQQDPRGAALLRNWASDFPCEDAEFVDDLGDSGPAVLFEERVWVAAKSPFEAADTSLQSHRIKVVRNAAASDSRGVPDVVFVDDFLLDKAPARVTAMLSAFDGA
ncbi:DEAD/DEAH box helicase [Streptomyces sp. ISL-96]|uniref:DEAD/DEAH box helicase n=1 Tax=Streptomyces sp. ISL-96 TaxID=2819191 RepID=UPI001BE9593A|nr:DEAD/DEAH box helicase [Streptomyces sp. ISL-96]MBT2488061.1 DEAD/DEAH box helicase [Streptomyces sp. ISL-96]